MPRTDAITVIGAGGIGCAVGYAFLSAGCDVEFVEADAEKVDAGNRIGTRVGARPHLPSRFIHFDDWRPSTERSHILCTKCYDNDAVLARLPADATVIPIQNGFDAPLEKRSCPVEGIASFVSECEPHQPITHITRHGDLDIGGRGNWLPDGLALLVIQLNQARLFRAKKVFDVLPIKHTKLMYNAAISPLAAAAGIDNGDLLRLPLARQLFFGLLRENYRILKAAHKPLGQVGPFHPDTVMKILKRPWVARAFARAFTPGLRGTYCSMAGDIEKGRTEISNYSGQLVAWAGDTPCPLNRKAIEVVERMTRESITPTLDALMWFDESR